MVYKIIKKLCHKSIQYFFNNDHRTIESTSVYGTGYLQIKEYNLEKTCSQDNTTYNIT